MIGKAITGPPQVGRDVGNRADVVLQELLKEWVRPASPEEISVPRLLCPPLIAFPIEDLEHLQSGPGRVEVEKDVDLRSKQHPCHLSCPRGTLDDRREMVAQLGSESRPGIADHRPQTRDRTHFK